MSTIEQAMRKELVKFLVQKAIFCGITGDVLDVRTCVVILDADGDPTAVMSQGGWQGIIKMADDNGIAHEHILKNGLHVDESTVRPA